jgi:hypothetical protein
MLKKNIDFEKQMLKRNMYTYISTFSKRIKMLKMNLNFEKEYKF